MKILITTDNIGGVWTFTINLAKELRKNGIMVSLAILGNPLNDNEKKELINFDWYFLKCKQEWMQDPWEDILKAGKWLIKLKKKVKPDLVHLNSFSYGALQWDIPVIITAHSCVQSWWDAVKQNVIPSDWDKYINYVKKGIQSADIITAPSNSMMRAVEKFYSPLKRKKIIYNGADKNLYYNDLKEGFVFSMGRLWDEAKNIKLIIEAAPEIRYPLFIAGDMRNNGLTNIPENVHFTGILPPDEIAYWLSKAAIYLLPVKYEPFGYTFLEAAFSNCALITGNIDSMREIWKNSVVYTDPENSHELAMKVNNLMPDKHKRELMAGKSTKRALLKYTIDRMASEYILIYGSMYERDNKRNLKIMAQ